MHILTKFHDDYVIHAKIMAISSTSTSAIFTIFYRYLKKKETAVILKRIDQLPQNLARVHDLVGPFDRSHKKFKLFHSSFVSIVFYCLSIVRLLFQL